MVQMTGKQMKRDLKSFKIWDNCKHAIFLIFFDVNLPVSDSLQDKTYLKGDNLTQQKKYF